MSLYDYNDIVDFIQMDYYDLNFPAVVHKDIDKSFKLVKFIKENRKKYKISSFFL